MEPIAGRNCDDDVISYDDDVISCDEDVISCDDDKLQCKEETETFKNIRNGDLSTLGKIWIRALKTVLVGADFCLIPVVYAAKPPEPPKRPPKMRYKDLPIYQSPHYEYKEYVASKDKCPNRNVRILHTALLPYVKGLRKSSSNAFCALCCSARCTCKDAYISIANSKNDFKKFMRDPSNLQLRQGVVAGGTLAGYLLGGGGGVPRRLFFTGLGALAAGSLCFPKETDEIFRNVSYHTSKCLIAAYNSMCGKDFAFRERLPCKDDLPPDPKPRKPVCPPKK